MGVRLSRFHLPRLAPLAVAGPVLALAGNRAKADLRPVFSHLRRPRRAARASRLAPSPRHRPGLRGRRPTSRRLRAKRLVPGRSVIRTTRRPRSEKMENGPSVRKLLRRHDRRTPRANGHSNTRGLQASHRARSNGSRRGKVRTAPRANLVVESASPTFFLLSRNRTSLGLKRNRLLRFVESPSERRSEEEQATPNVGRPRTERSSRRQYRRPRPSHLLRSRQDPGERRGERRRTTANANQPRVGLTSRNETSLRRKRFLQK